MTLIVKKMTEHKLLRPTTKFIIDELQAKTNPKIEIGRRCAYFSIGRGKTKTFTLVNPTCCDSYQKDSPRTVFDRYQQDYSIQEFLDLNDCKQIYLKMGKFVGETLQPIGRFYLEDIEFKMYRAILYRYDKNSNEDYILLEIHIPGNTEVVKIHLPYTDQFMTTYPFVFNTAAKIENIYGEMKDLFYRTYTANKSNQYKGYTKQSEIPDSLKDRASKKLILLGSYITRYSNRYGFNGLAVLLAWLDYWQKERSSGGLGKQLIGRERDHFEEIWFRLRELIYSWAKVNVN
jgi:hypothetical protein